VHTAFPANTDLLGNVPVDAAGVAEVNLTLSIRQASPSQLRSLSAQLLWTLRQVPDVTAVEILADGAAISVPGWGTRQPRTAWASYDPAAPPAVTAGLYRHGDTWRSTGSQVPGVAGLGPVDALVVSHDGTRLAGVRDGALFVERAGAAPVRRLRADSLTPPTFDPSGNVWTVVTRGADRWVAQVTPSGAVHRIVADPRLVSGQVQLMRLSRDGCRVAAIVGPTGSGRLLVGRVTQDRGELRLGAFRSVLADTADIRGLGWQNASELLVTASDSGGTRRLVAVDVDGYNTRTVTLSGLDTGPTDVAAAPDRPLLLVAGGAVWREDDGVGWRRLAAGSSPVYAD
jgi:hypothetical protein